METVFVLHFLDQVLLIAQRKFNMHPQSQTFLEVYIFCGMNLRIIFKFPLTNGVENYIIQE